MMTAMRTAYDAVRNQVKEATKEKGARRGMKSLFEKRRRQQEAQARRRVERREEQEGLDEVGELAAVEAEVPDDEAEGGSQSSRQEGPRVGHRSKVKRSLQEEWELEEESQGRAMEVQGDMEAGAQTGDAN